MRACARYPGGESCEVLANRCEARPGVCRDYPDTPHCGYYEFLKFERDLQDDEKFIAMTR